MGRNPFGDRFWITFVQKGSMHRNRRMKIGRDAFECFGQAADEGQLGAQHHHFNTGDATMDYGNRWDSQACVQLPRTFSTVWGLTPPRPFSTQFDRRTPDRARSATFFNVTRGTAAS